jgi:hypothetical protein
MKTIVKYLLNSLIVCGAALATPMASAYAHNGASKQGQNQEDVYSYKGGARLLHCKLDAPPRIMVTPKTSPIRYNHSLSSAQLDRMARGDAKNALKERDSSTGGLRLDRPSIETRVNYSYTTETLKGKATRVCLSYSDIEVIIELNPVIYIASEHKEGRCYNEILHHERQHVEMDRVVMNEFARNLGTSLKILIDKTGAQGPYPAHETEMHGTRMVRHINSVVDAEKMAMTNKMQRLQSRIDSPEEYARISRICAESRLR